MTEEGKHGGAEKDGQGFCGMAGHGTTTTMMDDNAALWWGMATAQQPSQLTRPNYWQS